MNYRCNFFHVYIIEMDISHWGQERVGIDIYPEIYTIFQKMKLSFMILSSMGRKRKQRANVHQPTSSYEHLSPHEIRRLKLRQHVIDQTISWRSTHSSRYCEVCEMHSQSNKNTHYHWMCDECLNSWFVERMKANKSLGCAKCDWKPSHDIIMRVLYPKNIAAYIAWTERMKKPLGIPHAGRCPRCGEISEKIGGCNNMVCICGETYCYRCGEVVFGTHRCPLQNPTRIMPPRELILVGLAWMFAWVISIFIISYRHDIIAYIQ